MATLTDPVLVAAYHADIAKKFFAYAKTHPEVLNDATAMAALETEMSSTTVLLTPPPGDLWSSLPPITGGGTPTPTLGLEAASDTGIDGDRVTTVARPVFTGVAEAGATVSLRIDGVPVGTGLAGATGIWRITPAAALTIGRHAITATATDADGNTSGTAGMGVVINGGAPAILQPAAARDVVGIVLENPLATALPTRAITFGQTFGAGQVRPTDALVARFGATTVAVQMDVKTVNPDGSVAMAILTLQQPALAAGTSAAAMLAVAGPATAAPAVNIAALTNAAAFDLKVNLTGIQEYRGTTVLAIADQRIDVGSLLAQALARGEVSYWLRGPQATQVRFETVVPDTPLRMTFDLTRYADGSISTDVQFNNDIALQTALGSATIKLDYDVAITQNGVPVLAQNDITQWQYQTWHHRVWSNGAPQVNIQQDMAALARAGAILNYDLTTGVSSNVILQQAANLGSDRFDILGPGDITRNMTWTAGRADIGPQPRWVATWLKTQDATARAYMLAQADAGGSVPWHFYDTAAGHHVSASDHPTLWLSRNKPSGWTVLPQQVATLTESGWAADTAHQPDLSYVAYLATGDRYYLDQLNAQATFDVLATYPPSRQNAQGLVANLSGQVRARAWSLRELVEAAAVNPEGSPMRAYFSQIAANNIQFLLRELPLLSAAQGDIHGWLPPPMSILGQETPGAISPWQQDFFATTLGLAAGLGIPGAADVLAWQTNFLAGRFINTANGFPAEDAVQYRMAVVDPVTGAPLTTWAQVEAVNRAHAYFKNAPGTVAGGTDYQAASKAALAAAFTWTGSPQALQAYGWLLAHTAGAATTYLQRAPGQDIVPRLSDGELLSSDMVFIYGDVGTAPVTLTGGNTNQLIYQTGSAPTTIVGGAGIDVLFGGSGATTLIGGAGDDFLFADTGATVFQPGSGNDFMQGGTGADLFDLVATDIGRDLIAGLQPGVDHLRVAGAPLGSTALARVIATASATSGGDAVLHLAAGHDVTLLGLAPSQLTPAIFN